ncbi:hypothetical protein [Shimia litoralis]|nr:hypothetical protein [Shimia litoralis]
MPSFRQKLLRNLGDLGFLIKQTSTLMIDCLETGLTKTGELN